MKSLILIWSIFSILILAWATFAVTLVRADELDWDALIPAIIQVESSGNPYAISEDGCVGLMQVSPIVLKEFNKEHEIHVKDFGKVHTSYFNIGEMYEGGKNTRVGTWYLHRLKDHYLKENYTLERLIAAYNCGPTKLRKVNYGISKCPAETRKYIKKVLRIYEKTKTN